MLLLLACSLLLLVCLLLLFVSCLLLQLLLLVACLLLLLACLLLLLVLLLLLGWVLLRQQINLVPDFQHPVPQALLRHAQLSQHADHRLPLLQHLGAACIQHVEQQVRFCHLLQRCLERLHQLGWEAADEAYCV
jgi:hypothetical protein